MNNKMLLGVMAGSMLMFVFSLGAVLGFGFSGGSYIVQENLLVNLVIMLLTPVAGGFLAGLISRGDARRTGLVAGLVASSVLCIFWLAINGLTWQTILTGLVLIFVWMIFARIGAGFSMTR